jgi:hypothetical protein
VLLLLMRSWLVRPISAFICMACVAAEQPGQHSKAAHEQKCQHCSKRMQIL